MGYTGPMYERLNEKLGKLKERYGTLFQSLHGEEEESVEEKRISELLVNSEDLFHKTYSIKYFGVQDDQIGVLSRRVPLKNAENQRKSQSTNKRHENKNRDRIVSSQSKETSQELHTSRSLKTMNEPPESPRSYGMPSTPRDQKNLELVIQSKLQDSQQTQNTFHGIIKPTTRAKKRPSLNNISLEENDNQQKLEANTSITNSNHQEYITRSENQNHLITTYFAPKRLPTTHNKHRITPRAETTLTQLYYDQTIDQKYVNSVDFGRNLKTLSRVRRNMIRNINLKGTPRMASEEKAISPERNYTDFNSTKTPLSYAKLLQNLKNRTYFNENAIDMVPSPIVSGRSKNEPISHISTGRVERQSVSTQTAGVEKRITEENPYKLKIPQDYSTKRNVGREIIHIHERDPKMFRRFLNIKIKVDGI